MAADIAERQEPEPRSTPQTKPVVLVDDGRHDHVGVPSHIRLLAPYMDVRMCIRRG